MWMCTIAAACSCGWNAGIFIAIRDLALSFGSVALRSGRGDSYSLSRFYEFRCGWDPWMRLVLVVPQTLVSRFVWDDTVFFLSYGGNATGID
eukprot:scaffold154780_cov32-Attheya_sp.AAC.1